MAGIVDAGLEKPQKRPRPGDKRIEPREGLRSLMAHAGVELPDPAAAAPKPTPTARPRAGLVNGLVDGYCRSPAEERDLAGPRKLARFHRFGQTVYGQLATAQHEATRRR